MGVVRRKAGRFCAEGLERRLMLAVGPALFAAQQTLLTGTKPHAVAAADVNGDGRADLVVANLGSNTVGVLLGNGDGKFQGQRTFATGSQPIGVAVSDINLDGRLDLVVANFAGNTIGVLRGNGDGNFAVQQTFAAAGGPASIAVADVNGDGRPDVMAALYSGNGAGVLLGNGSGNLGAEQSFTVGSHPIAIAAGDLNSDGKVDLALADFGGGAVSTLLGNGNGTFGTHRTFGAGTNPRGIAVADINGDGKLDAAVANFGSAGVGVLLGNGNGALAAQQTFGTGAGSQPLSVAVADLNRDGKLDLAVANFGSATASTLPGNGNGTFAGQRTWAAGAGPMSVEAADVNGDGALDLVVANYNGASASILLGGASPRLLSIDRSNPAGERTSASSVTFAVRFSEPVTGVDATDFALSAAGVTAATPVVVGGGAGGVYAVTVNGIGGVGTLGLNLVDNGSIKDADGNALWASNGAAFAAQQTLAAPGTNDVAVGDVNGDGRPDLISTANGTSGLMNVALGNGDGTFAPTLTTGIKPSTSVTLADVNSDGRLDAITGAGVGYLAAPGIGIYLGNGNGTFQANSNAANGYAFSPQVADVTGDGKPDIVYAAGGGVGFLTGNGNGTFGPGGAFAGSHFRSHELVVSDLDSDGKADLIFTRQTSLTYTGTDVGVVLGNGNGTFQALRTFTTGINPKGVAVADVNGDGKADVVVANYGTYGNTYQSPDYSGNTVSVLLGNGDGTFQEQHKFSTGRHPYRVTIGDVNADGAADLVVCESFIGNGAGPTQPGEISVLLGNGNGTFRDRMTLAAGVEPVGSVVADVNRDGREDLVVANFLDPTPQTGYSIGIIAGVADAGLTGQRYRVVPPFVAGISRAAPTGPDTSLGSVTFAVTFDGAVTGVDASDFRVVTGGGVSVSTPVAVSGGGAAYSVTVGGIHGNGSVELDLVDDDSIHGASSGTELGGAGVGNGGFSGPAYNVSQTFPRVVSIARQNPGGATVATGSTANFSVTFSKPVTGVDAGDFVAVKSSHVSAAGPTNVSGGGATYTVTVGGVSGMGTLGLNLVDDGSIRDLTGNPLSSGGTVNMQATGQTFAIDGRPLSVSIADMDGDGKPDLVTTNRSASFDSFLGNGNGTFSGSRHVTTPFGNFAGAVEDVSGDGKPDLTLPSDGAIDVWLNGGGNNFTEVLPLAFAGRPVRAIASDLDGDGRPDVVVSNLQDNSVGVWMGNGNGTFSPRGPVLGFTQPYVFGEDVNGDGELDLVVANHDANNVSVMLGHGDGYFAPGQTFGTGVGPIYVATADVNGDGKRDLAVSNDGAASVSVLMGNGDGSFQGQETFATNAAPKTVVVSDLNGDGKPDLAVACGGQYRLDVLLGNGDGSFGAAASFLAYGANPRGLAAGDLNGDGRPDLVVANYTAGGSLRVLLNGANGGFTGEAFDVRTQADVVAGAAGVDAITLVRDADQVHIDWTLGAGGGQLLVGDPNGLTVIGNGGADVITLDYSNGNPMPNTVHLNGDFTINGLAGSTPLAGTTMEVGRSTVRISYAGPGADPLNLIKQYLAGGYNGGGWDGTSAAGVITSADARNNASHNTGIAWVDSAEGSPLNAVANTILLKYAVIGDTDLDGTVGLSDYTAVVRNFGVGTNWDQGVVTYDGTVGLPDYTAVVRNFGQVTPAAAPSVVVAGVMSPTTRTPVSAEDGEADLGVDPGAPVRRSGVKKPVARKSSASR